MAAEHGRILVSHDENTMPMSGLTGLVGYSAGLRKIAIASDAPGFRANSSPKGTPNRFTASPLSRLTLSFQDPHQQLGGMANFDTLGHMGYSQSRNSGGSIMNVHLTPELEQLVQTRVKSGRYNSASEVVREALRLLEQRDEVFTLRKAEIRKQLEEGWQSAKSGDLVDGDEVFNRIDAELEVMKRATRK